MSGIRLHSLEMLHLLWLIPLLTGLFLYSGQQRRAALLQFVRQGLLARLPVTASPTRRFFKATAVLAALTGIVIALARPAWNPTAMTVKRSGRDVVFVLDVSRSMLAEDLAPNRLERAKLAIDDCVGRLRGDRVALVAFAGTATVKCPLTLDYGFFRMILETIRIDSINRGGSMLGDALRTVADQVLDDQVKQYKDIILITDGGDHGSFPEEAARAAGEQGVRLIIVGLGDEREGQRIPVIDAQGRRAFLKYQGREVWTRLDPEPLRRMAGATPGGVYLPVATGNIDLGEVYTELVATAQKKELEAKTITRYEEKFQIFLAIAILLLGLEGLLSETGKAGGVKP